MTTSHYLTLGVAESATAAEIRSAYLTKAQVAHPDRQGGSDQQMRAVNDAWAVLGDPDKRRDYDLQLHPRTMPNFGGTRPEPTVEEPDRPPEADGTSPAVFHMVRSAPTILVLLVLGGLFFLSAFANGGGEPQQRPNVSIEVGDCITEAAGSIRRVPCDGSTTGIAQAIVAEAQDCVSRPGTHAVPLPTAPKFVCIGPPG